MYLPVVSLFLVIVLSLSLSINVAAQPQISAAETVTRICEVETLRETNSETYLLSDGTYECVLYAEDKYYLDNSQSLRLIDNSITRVDATTYTTSGQYKNAANAFMEPYPEDDYRAYNFYHAILMGNADAFCNDCANELSELLWP